MAITEIQRARAALAAAEQAHNQARAKDQECRALLVEVQSRPPATDLRTQVAHASERAGVEAARDAIRREVNEAAALVNLRRSELEATLERAAHARAQLDQRQQRLSERRALLARTQAARQAVAPLADSEVWRILPELARAADAIINTASQLQQEIGWLTVEVEQLQAHVDHWGEP